MKLEYAARLSRPEFDWASIESTLIGTHDGIIIVITSTKGVHRIAGRFGSAMTSEDTNSQSEALKAIPRILQLLLS